MPDLRAFESALFSLKADPVRTRAAFVALALSVAVLICLTSLVERGRATTIRALEKAGLSNLYLVRRSGGRAPGLDALEAGRLSRLVGARQSVRLRSRSGVVAGASGSVEAPVYAVAGDLRRVFDVRPAEGRLLGDVDVDRRLPYCVLGARLARVLAPARSALGSSVTISGRDFEVVGTLALSDSETAGLGDLPALDWDRALVLPLGSEPAADVAPAERYPLDAAVLRFPSTGGVEPAARFLPHLDPARYGASGAVLVTSPLSALRSYRVTRRAFDRLVALVGLLTALSAVLGISNLLSASVAARSREIGVRRAVGARARDIVLQFELEGLLLGVAGGAAGVALGLAIALAAGEKGGGGAISIASLAVLGAIAAGIGVAAGIRPAMRAARIDPAQALREG